MQKALRLNDGHAVYLGLLAKKEGARRGYLSKRSSDNTKWHPKWFALLQNMLFYFENDSSSRPAGLYLLEGCLCDRAPSPKPKDALEKQVGWEHLGGRGEGAHGWRSGERLGNSDPASLFGGPPLHRGDHVGESLSSCRVYLPLLPASPQLNKQHRKLVFPTSAPQTQRAGASPSTQKISYHK